MFEEKKLYILIAVDSSLHSDAVMELATLISWPLGSYVSVLVVLPERWLMVDSTPNEQNVVHDVLRKIHQEDQKAAEQLADQFADLLGSHQFSLRTEIIDGSPSLAILQAAAEFPADLVVICAQGLSPPDHHYLGAAAHKIAHYADCSVLVARPFNLSQPLGVVLAIDGSPEAQQAVDFLCSLSLSQWAYVTVVGIADVGAGFPVNKNLSPDDAVVSYSTELSSKSVAHSPQAVHDALIEAAEVRVAQVVRRLRRCGAQVSSIIRVGNPAEEILNIAKEQSAALIALGARGQTRIEPFPIGSVAQKVVKYARCSVLVARN